jgi:S-DNA-T family DNA segregation ATPase FtsK/SpoIIIE
VVPLGLDYETVEVQKFIMPNSLHLILGTSGSGKTNVLKIVLEGLGSTEKILLVDSREMELIDYAQFENVAYGSTAAQMADLLEMLKEITEKRTQDFAAQSGITPRQYYASLPAISVIIDDFENFLELLKGSGMVNAENIVRDSITAGVGYVATALSSRMRGFDELTKLFKETTSGLILGIPFSQTVWQISANRYKPQPDSALLYSKGEVVPVKLPLIEENKK